MEIGGKVRSESELSSVTVDWPYLSQLITRFADVRVYHFHPLPYFERCIKLVAANALSDENIKALVTAHPNDLGKAVQKLAESMTGGYLRVDLLSP